MRPDVPCSNLLPAQRHGNRKPRSDPRRIRPYGPPMQSASVRPHHDHLHPCYSSWEFASASSVSERTPRPKTIRGARFTAVERAAQIAALQHFNNVWTRRALQEKTVRLEYTVLHQCIRPRIGADAPDHHGIRARPISLAAMPRRAIRVISSQMRWKDHFSISSVSLADLGGKSESGPTSRVS
jgi:hypothetical protein